MGISLVVLTVTLCAICYKSGFSLESLISLLLAFFSIFISIFFYFKADETSKRFHDNSYTFMKDISVTLGKIEERFAEKLNSLNDKVTSLSTAKNKKYEELQTAEEEKQKLINDLMDKAKLDENQKTEYKEKLRKKDEETETLKRQLRKIDLQYKNALKENTVLRSNPLIIDNDIDKLRSDELVNSLLLFNDSLCQKHNDKHLNWQKFNSDYSDYIKKRNKKTSL